MRSEQIAAIPTACIKANPEIEQWCASCEQFTAENMKACARCDKFHQRYPDLRRPIRLADVLLAIHVQNGVEEVTTFRDKDFYNSRWNLRADDLEQQSDETIAFIHSLLGDGN